MRRRSHVCIHFGPTTGHFRSSLNFIDFQMAPFIENMFSLLANLKTFVTRYNGGAALLGIPQSRNR
jgi:hypothetical protein